MKNVTLIRLSYKTKTLIVFFFIGGARLEVENIWSWMFDFESLTKIERKPSAVSEWEWEEKASTTSWIYDQALIKILMQS